MNNAVADLIAKGLQEGLVHPGDPTKGQDPIAIPLPLKTVGMPPELKRQVQAQVKLMAEAITALIETRYTIIDTDEFAALRNTADLADSQPGQRISLHCRCDTNRRNPLLRLTVKGEHAIVDGRQLLTGLTKRSVDCPHNIL